MITFREDTWKRVHVELRRKLGVQKCTLSSSIVFDSTALKVETALLAAEVDSR